MGSIIDDVGEGLAGPRRHRRDVLRSMATDLVLERPLQDILDDAAAEAAETAGAQRSAIMFSDGGGEFSVLAATGDHALPARFTIASPTEALIDVAWGRTQLVWPSSESHEPVLPFIGTPGWDRVLVVGMRITGGGFGLVAVGGPVEGDWDPDAVERLDLAATLINAAVAGANLRSQFARLEELLRGAVTTSAGLAGLASPREVRDQVVEGIVEQMQLPGAALWLANSNGDDGAVMVASAGLPPEVRDALSALPSSDPVAETAAGLRRWLLPSESESAQAWPGHHLHLVPVPEPMPGALGIYSTQPLPAAADEVFATLAQALASAVEQTTHHRRMQTVVDALQKQLRPRLFELPPGMEAGLVYQSATAGVPIGGDFLDLFTTATGHIGLACGDVSGKGIEAATLSAMAVYSLRAFALQGATPRIVMAMMDSAVEAQTGDDRFATMIYGRISPREWTVELAVAGHPPPVLVGPTSVEVQDVPADVPVGMLGDAMYHQASFHLPADHSLVLYTDGVTEARSSTGEGPGLFGIERLVAALDGLRGRDAQGLADGVWEAVQEWTGGNTTDDCAVVVLRRCPAE